MIKRCYRAISHVCRQVVVTLGKLQAAFVLLESWNFILLLKDDLCVGAQGKWEEALCLSGSPFRLVQDPASTSSPVGRVTLWATLGNRKNRGKKCHVSFWLVFTSSEFSKGKKKSHHTSICKAFVQWSSGSITGLSGQSSSKSCVLIDAVA